MFTNKDIEFRNIYVVNCISKKELRLRNGELLLEDIETNTTLTKLPFQKILILFIIGHIRVTTPLIEKCRKYNVALVVVNTSLRPVFYWHNSAEANFLLRKKQYELGKDDITIAKHLVSNKIQNQKALLQKTRKKDIITIDAIHLCEKNIVKIRQTSRYETLMGLEGETAKNFFNAYFHDYNWKGRKPRVKCDYINIILDIGYTYLFNFIECFVRMFGFDVYVGVYHRLWFKRKSLICDLIEPFRCIIDKTIRSALNRNQFNENDFELIKGELHLKREKNPYYCKVFMDAITPYKSDVFRFVQKYYRCFMSNKDISQYPVFEIL